MSRMPFLWFKTDSAIKINFAKKLNLGEDLLSKKQ